MKKAAKLVFDHEAFNAPQPERVTRKRLMNGMYATMSYLKLQPGEKPKDPNYGFDGIAGRYFTGRSS